MKKFFLIVLSMLVIIGGPFLLWDKIAPSHHDEHMMEISSVEEVEREYPHAAEESKTVDQPSSTWVAQMEKALPEGPFMRRYHTLSLPQRQRIMHKIWKAPVITNDIEELRIGREGELFYVCKGLCAHHRAVPASTTLPSDRISSYHQSVPISSPPALNSRPHAAHTIFLDFNGMIVSNTFWNSDPDYMVDSWDTRPFSRDTDETTFSPLEQQDIEDIWRGVTAKFEPFDVNITTVDPAPNPYYYHLLITTSYDKNGIKTPLYGIGGVALLGDKYRKLSTYSEAYLRYYNPAWVKGAVGYTIEDITMLCAHELGHNFGLYHDGTSNNVYYRGHGDIPSWGPIMGSPYDKNMVTWSKGDYAGANNRYDHDIEVIAYALDQVADETGGTMVTSTLLEPSLSGDFTHQGVINSQFDVDLYEIDMPYSGLLNLYVYPSTNANYGFYDLDWQSPLKLKMQICDELGAVIVSEQLPYLLHVETSFVLEEGLYYIELQGVGTGDPYASTPSGFTDYGSIGAYYLSGSVPATDDLDGDDLPDVWEMVQFGSVAALPSDDPDGDGSDNYSEYIAGTDPNNPYSTFSIAGFWVDELGSHLVWNPVEGRSYRVQLSTVPATNTFSPISETLNYPSNRFTDTVERTEATLFYRLEVDMP